MPDCTPLRAPLRYVVVQILRGKSNKRGEIKAGATNLGYVAPTHGNGHCPHPSIRLGIWIHRMPELSENIKLSPPRMQPLCAKKIRC